MGNKQDERLQKLQSELEQGVLALTSSEGWAAMLSTASRFRKYSFGNLMLIYRQCPDASRVAGFQAWKGLGRQVRKGESALWILAPMTYRRRDAETGEDVFGVRGFKAVPVFDIAQTDGEPIADVRPELLEGEAPEGLWDGLAKQVASAGFQLARCESAEEIRGANGQTDFLARVVTVRADMDDAQAVKTLVHELAHIELGHESDNEHRGTGEVEAESVAFVVAGAVGLATDAYSFPYVARWAGGDPKTVKATAERVVKAAGAILAGLEDQ